MDQATFIKKVTARIAGDATVEALFLAGSYGRGTADEYSDVDLIALVPADRRADFAKTWRHTLEDIAPIVFWNEMPIGPGLLVNAITEKWLRCDVSITAPADFKGKSRDTIRPLVDRGGFYDALPETLPLRTPNVGRVTYLINEFIRVIGLAPVGVGRREYVTMVMGVGLLRDMLINLMIEETTMPDTGGILHMSKVLPAPDVALVYGLPYPGPQLDEILAANMAIAKAFFPRARALSARLGIAWPEAFETATRRNLRSRLGDDYDWA